MTLYLQSSVSYGVDSRFKEHLPESCSAGYKIKAVIRKNRIAVNNVDIKRIVNIQLMTSVKKNKTFIQNKSE